MKYNAIVDSGIPILRRYDIPDHLIPPVRSYPAHSVSSTLSSELQLMSRTRKSRSTPRLQLDISAAQKTSRQRIFISQSGEHGRIWSISLEERFEALKRSCIKKCMVVNAFMRDWWKKENQRDLWLALDASDFRPHDRQKIRCKRDSNSRLRTELISNQSP